MRLSYTGQCLNSVRESGRVSRFRALLHASRSLLDSAVVSKLWRRVGIPVGDATRGPGSTPSACARTMLALCPTNNARSSCLSSARAPWPGRSRAGVSPTWRSSFAALSGHPDRAIGGSTAPRPDPQWRAASQDRTFQHRRSLTVPVISFDVQQLGWSTRACRRVRGACGAETSAPDCSKLTLGIMYFIKLRARTGAAGSRGRQPSRVLRPERRVVRAQLCEGGMAGLSQNSAGRPGHTVALLRVCLQVPPASRAPKAFSVASAARHRGLRLETLRPSSQSGKRHIRNAQLPIRQRARKHTHAGM